MSLKIIDETLAADGSSAVLDWDGRFVGHFSAYGTFGGGTASLQYSTDGGSNYRDVDSTNLAFTADGQGNFELPKCKLKVVLAGATSPSLSVYVTGISAISQ